MAAQALLPDTRPRRGGPAFALTPLADVVFQLLVFFMLAAGVSPYSLLPLAAPAAEAAGIAAPWGGGSAAWHISSGRIRAGNAAIAIADLPEALEALRGVEIGEIVLFATPGATVQDLATVLETLSLSGITAVRLMARPGAEDGG